MKKTNLLFKRILPCLLILITVFTLVSCKGCNKQTVQTSYPSVTPQIDKPTDAYLTIGDYKVTNETVYARLLKQYGLETLEDMIIKDIIAGTEYDKFYSEEDFKKNLDEIIYGDLTDEAERAEALEEFELDMRASGFFSKEAYEAYYKYTYDKMNYVVKVFKDYIAKYDADEANEEDFFTEEAYKDYYEANNRPKVSIILITFDSQHQANKVMESVGINLNKLNGNWEINGTTINAESTAEEIKAYKEQLQEAFTTMYTAMTGSSEAVKVYEDTDLSKVSSTILTKVYNLSALSSEATEDITKSYTHAPTIYGTRYFLTLKVSEDYTGITKYEDANKEEIFHALVENSISEHNITKIFGEEFAEAGLKIYDEGLETSYITKLTNAYSQLGTTDEMTFAATTEESDKNIATYTINGQTKTITAQMLYDEMLKQYGAALTFSLLQQYSVLSNEKYSKIYNIKTGQILDQTKYDEYKKTDVTQYKTSFEAGNYASSGYPASYGWENFLRDYLGVNSEEDLMTALDASIFVAAQDEIAKEIWLEVKKVVNDEGVEETQYDDTLVQKEMENIFNSYYNASIIGLYTFYDKDNNGVGDYYGVGTDTDSVSEELLTFAYNKAFAIVERDAYLNKTLETALSEVVNQYNLATSQHSEWGKYKAVGLRLFVITTVTYTSSSSINEDLSKEVKALWDSVVAWKDAKDDNGLKIGADITGKTLDPSYRYTVTNDVKQEGSEVTEKVTTAHSVSSKNFTSHTFFTNNTNEEEDQKNIAYRISITKATKATYIKEETGIYKPAYLDYQTYLEDGKTMKAAITAYYIPAINNVLKINGVSGAKTLNKILELCEAELANVKVSVNNTEVLKQVQQLLADTKVVENTDAE